MVSFGYGQISPDSSDATYQIRGISSHCTIVTTSLWVFIPQLCDTISLK